MQYEGHRLRHELKYYINYDMYHILRQRLNVVVGMDENMPDEEGYLVSSLYFDDMHNSALNEKNAGIKFRKKFRIRSYGLEDKLIRLECKSKFNEYISKTSAKLTRAEYDSILSGDYDFLLNRNETVCKELCCYNKTKLLTPKVVVEYRREAYISKLGNVRITFDKDISASVGNLDMFASDYATSKIFNDDIMVLEVKYDDYLPSHIWSILQMATADHCAVSKYVLCREHKRKERII